MLLVAAQRLQGGSTGFIFGRANLEDAFRAEAYELFSQLAHLGSEEDEGEQDDDAYIQEHEVPAVRPFVMEALMGFFNVKTLMNPTQMQEIVDALALGNGYVLDLLMAEGNAWLHRLDIGGRGWLHWAAVWGYAPLVEALIRWGAVVDQEDIGGETALQWAVRHGRMDVADILSDAGADYDHLDHTGRSPRSLMELHQARQQQNWED